MMTEEQARKHNFERLDSSIGFIGCGILSNLAILADQPIAAVLLVVSGTVLLLHYIAVGDYK